MRTRKITDRETLLLAIRSGTRPKYFLFWGHRPLPGNEIGKPCLSQWWPAPFIVDGVRYPTAEHFMMAEKARLFGDNVTRAAVLDAANPRAAKQLGRGVRGFVESHWQDARYALVVRGNFAKFSQNPVLGQFLRSTAAQVLVEASPVDRIWGIGLAADDERAVKPEQWRGLNLLGFALMQVREQLKNSGT
jgi:ribA/ribD-fused uncharacterized protein